MIKKNQIKIKKLELNNSNNGIINRSFSVKVFESKLKAKLFLKYINHQSTYLDNLTFYELIKYLILINNP